MKSIKKPCLFLLCTLLLALLLPSLAGAADSDFQIVNGVLTRYTGPGGKVVVPEGVTSIGFQAFYNCSSLTNIVIPEGVISIESYAFDGCEKLTSVVIPKSVTSIESYAFRWCESLTSIVIPEGVTTIRDGAFDHCDNLTSVTLPSTLENLGESVFRHSVNLTSIIDKSGRFAKTVDGIVYRTDGTQMIAVLASASGEIHIAEGVTEIPASLFENNDRITGIVIPEGVTSIGSLAFNSCNSLTSIVLPEGVASIGDWAFMNCKNLTNMVLRDGITSIGNSAFYGCKALTDIVLPEGVTSIENGAFCFCKNLTSVTLPSTLKILGVSGSAGFGGCEIVFAGCTNLTSIIDKGGTFLKTVDGIVYSADGTRMIAVLTSASGEIRIADGVTEIPTYLFSDNDRITSAVIPEGVTTIRDSAFIQCKNLASVVIPRSVTTIEKGAFFGCTALTSVVIPEGVTRIGYGAFQGSENLTSVTLPSTLSVIGDEAFPISTIIRSEPNTYAHTWALKNGYTWQPAGQAESKVMKLPADLKIVRQEAFRDSAAECVVLPDGCAEIGAKAFAACAMLRRVEIPASVAVIAEDAFEGCSNELVIVTPKGSAAESFAQAHGISVTYAEP